MREFFLGNIFKLTFGELISYFSVEIMCVLGIIINFIISLFILKNLKLKRLSDIVTCIIFCINSMILFALIFQNENFLIKNDIVVFNNSTLFLKLSINLFALFFVIATYKFTRKARHRVPLINSILILIIMLSGFLLTSDNFTFIYVLLEIIIILIYNYASNMRLVKGGIYSLQYIVISFSATCIFVLFYFLDYIVADLLQKSIMQSCMAIGILLKIGLFPIYNYSVDKNCRSNIPYSILLFCLLPFIGAVAFNKIMSFYMFNEVCQLSISAFILLCALFASISAYKTKNITSYLTYAVQIYICFYMLNSMLTKDFNPYFIIIVMFLSLIVYGLVRIYKNKKLYSAIFSVLIVIVAFIIPIFALNILFNLYTFDKIGFYIMNVFVFCNILLIIKTLKIIESLYKIKPAN